MLLPSPQLSSQHGVLFWTVLLRKVLLSYWLVHFGVFVLICVVVYVLVICVVAVNGCVVTVLGRCLAVVVASCVVSVLEAVIVIGCCVVVDIL